ncbi:MAG: porin family protein [Carboxylicivirga sp.]|nr:porin family protein [Carboxylicivirga sp.]
MKKLIITLTFTLIVCFVQAQFQKGMKEVGGSISYSNNHEDNENNNGNGTTERQGFSIKPTIGWFISETTAIGIGISYSCSNIDHESPNYEHTNKSNRYYFTPYLRNYKPINDKLFYFTTVSLSYGIGKQEMDDREYDHNYLSISASPGLCYFLSDKWALKTEFGNLYYQWSKNKTTNDWGDELETTNNGFGISLDLSSIQFGATYYF